MEESAGEGLWLLALVTFEKQKKITKMGYRSATRVGIIEHIG
jgi:hypothetical protein